MANPYGYGWMPMQGYPGIQGYPGPGLQVGPSLPSSDFSSLLSFNPSAQFAGMPGYTNSAQQSVTTPYYGVSSPMLASIPSFNNQTFSSTSQIMASPLDYLSMTGGSLTSMMMTMVNSLVGSVTSSGMLNWGAQGSNLQSWYASLSNTGSSNAAPSGTVSGAGITQTDAMKRLAAAGQKSARENNTSGKCLKGVNDAMESVGLGRASTNSACDADDILASRPDKFKEIKVSKDQLKSLPPGCIIIWGDQDNKHGHATITQANGRETSDHEQSLIIKKTATFRVFIPLK